MMHLIFVISLFFTSAKAQEPQIESRTFKVLVSTETFDCKLQEITRSVRNIRFSWFEEITILEEPYFSLEREMTFTHERFEAIGCNHELIKKIHWNSLFGFYPGTVTIIKDRSRPPYLRETVLIELKHQDESIILKSEILDFN